MKKRIIFVFTAAMLFFSQVIFSSCGDEEEDEPVQNNSGKNNSTNNNQQTVKEESKYTVSYSSDFGVAPQNFTVKEGDKLTSGDLKPLDTDGYIFLGWYNGSNQVEEGFVVKQDLKLVAKWEAKQILVSYSTQFGTAPNDISVKQGESLSSNDLKELSYNGYEFLGWYDGDKIIECGFVVEKNVILIAKWKKKGIYVVDLNNFLAQQSDESKVYDVTVLDIKPDVDAIISALEAHPNIKVNLDLEECTELKEVIIAEKETDHPTHLSGSSSGGGTSDDNGNKWVPTDDDLFIDNMETDHPTHLSGGSNGGGTSDDNGNTGIPTDDDLFIGNLISITLPNGVVNIVLGCDGLTSLNIPNSVKEIYIYVENPPTIHNANTINDNCTIYVPASAVETYKNADGWSKYAVQIEPIGHGESNGGGSSDGPSEPVYDGSDSK